MGNTKQIETPVLYIVYMTVNESGDTQFGNINVPGTKDSVSAMKVKEEAKNKVPGLVQFMIVSVTEFVNWDQLRGFFSAVPKESTEN